MSAKLPEPIDLKLPPGLYGNGTPYAAKGRYATGNLVRFVNGFPRPIGGWARRTDNLGVDLDPIFADPSTEAARLAIQWTDNAANSYLAVGTNLGLYVIGASGSITDITPVGFTTGAKDSGVIAGYGTGRYGLEAYGTPRSSENAPFSDVGNWSFALFGEVLLAQFRGSGPLYSWTPGDPAAVAVANAPEDAQGVIVTQERIVMTINGEARLVEWSDSESTTTWTPTVTNSAGSQRLTGSGKLVAIAQVGREILIVCKTDAYIGRYLGPPFIYGFESVTENTGCLAPNSMIVIDGRAYWYGPGGFWTYDGSVRQMDCEVQDWLIRMLDPAEVSKMSAVHLPTYREVWWFFQSLNGEECDTYIVFNYAEGHWSYGSLARTCGVSAGALRNPTYIGADGYIYTHEQRGVAVTPATDAYIETGPLELGMGGRQLGVQFIYPDLAAVAEAGTEVADITLIGRDFPSPNEPAREYGPYPLTRPSPTTGARGRQISVRYTGKTARWVVGVPRLVVTPMGER